MLETRNLRSGYGRIPILDGLSFSVKKGEVVGILGHNGMGKTTLLKTLIGEIRVTGGEIFLNDKNITESEMFLRSRAGMAYVPQGREIFPNLTVLENLRMGEITRPNDSAIVEVLEYFPILKELLDRLGGRLSGGQQQILAIARCLVARPSIILLDEPTEGIQPSIVDQIIEKLKELQKLLGLTVLLVEQDLHFIQELCDRALVMQKGRISAELSHSDLKNLQIIESHLGL